MPLPRRPAYAGLVLAALVTAPGSASGDRATQVPQLRPAIVAAGPEAATVTLPAGAWRTELAWLLPGDGDPLSRRTGRASRSRARAPATARSTLRTRDRRGAAADGKPQAGRPTARLVTGRPAHRVAGRRAGAGRRSVRDARRRHAQAASRGWAERRHRPDVVSRRGPHRIRLQSRRRARPLGGLERRRRPRAAPRRRRRCARPAWSPDGRRLAFSGPCRRPDAYLGAALATLAARRVTRSAESDLRPDWSPDGTRLAFTRSHRGSTRTWIVRVERRSAPRPWRARTVTSTPTGRLPRARSRPAQSELLPDLDQRRRRSWWCSPCEAGSTSGFTSAVDSIGRGPLRDSRLAACRTSGHARRSGDRAAWRRLASPSADVGTLLYQAHPPHRHWHFQQFESYELRRASDHVLVGRDRKSGFCLIDRYGRVVRPGSECRAASFRLELRRRAA